MEEELEEVTREQERMEARRRKGGEVEVSTVQCKADMVAKQEKEKTKATNQTRKEDIPAWTTNMLKKLRKGTGWRIQKR